MTKDTKYKLQGNGLDSWEIREFDEKGDMTNAYMVYEDPNIPVKTDLSKIDIDSLTDEQIIKLKERFSRL